MTWALGALTLLIWLVLWLRHGGFWRTNVSPVPAPPANWPAVVAVIPARDEAEGIGRTIASLLTQDYKGRLSIVLVDDESTDGTAELARQAARSAGAENRLHVVAGTKRPDGWVGKMWAVSQGVAKAHAIDPAAGYLLLTDGDVRHSARNVSHLVARAEAGALDLTSVMVRLRCVSLAERMLIPAFVFFFQMLYPFEKVNDPSDKTAASAGGCMLVRVSALARIGGIAAIRGALIDDCALAAAMKPNGPIWVGLTNEAESMRVYGSFGEVWRMVARSAYTQLNYSPILLLGTVTGLLITFVAPPLLFLFAHNSPWAFGFAAWLIMMGCYTPMLHFYGLSRLWAPLLPIVAIVYLGATIDSAVQHVRGVGGTWKGRIQAAR
jgi:hopene-associated glycosyltransferase HpnB